MPHDLPTLLTLAESRRATAQAALSALQEAQGPLLHAALKLMEAHEELFESLYEDRGQLDDKAASYEREFGTTPGRNPHELQWAREGDRLKISGLYWAGDCTYDFAFKLPLRYLEADGRAQMEADAAEMRADLERRQAAAANDAVEAQRTRELTLLAQLKEKYGDGDGHAPR